MRLEDIKARYPGAETFKFGDNRVLCDALLALVRAGKKTASRVFQKYCCRHRSPRSAGGSVACTSVSGKSGGLEAAMMDIYPLDHAQIEGLPINTVRES